MVNLNSAAILTTLVGMIVTGGEAAGETVGTACLAKTAGEIYALAPYKSAPSGKCRAGDQTIRVSLHQPGTSFAKRSATIGAGGGVEIVRFDPHGDLLIHLRLEADSCELVASELDRATEHVVARVPRGKWQHGMHEVIYTDDDRRGPDGDSFTETFASQQLVLTDHGGALLFHDVFVDHRGPACSVTFLVEFALDAQQLFDQ